MAHECRCGHESAAVRDAFELVPRSIRADQTVADVARSHAGALQVMKEMGLNHCCGAHLSLREAAAAAGVPLEALLSALNGAGEAPAEAPAEPSQTAAPRGSRRVLDVRGLEPPQPMLRVLEEIERLDPGARLEVHHDRRPLLLYPRLDDRGFRHETDEPEPGLVRIQIWKGD